MNKKIITDYVVNSSLIHSMNVGCVLALYPVEFWCQGYNNKLTPCLSQSMCFGEEARQPQAIHKNSQVMISYGEKWGRG